MKKTYIQPEIETAVMPMKAIMGDPIALAGSPTGPTTTNPAPRRRDQVF